MGAPEMVRRRAREREAQPEVFQDQGGSEESRRLEEPRVAQSRHRARRVSNGAARDGTRVRGAVAAVRKDSQRCDRLFLRASESEREIMHGGSPGEGTCRRQEKGRRIGATRKRPSRSPE